MNSINYIFLFLFSLCFIFLGLSAITHQNIESKKDAIQLNQHDNAAISIDIQKEKEKEKSYLSCIAFVFGIVCVLATFMSLVTGHIFSCIIFGILAIIMFV